MPLIRALLFILLVAKDARSEAEVAGPNCNGVGDFKACLGNTHNFCPTNISCQCKDEKPFCRCDYFRVGWQEYWYMGPKCNHLWNTLDFILVAVIPAVVLVIIVIVIFSCVMYCKSEKTRKQANPPSHGAQHNPAFAAEIASSLRSYHQQSPRDDQAWVGHIPKAVTRRQDFDDVPSSRQLENYSPVHPQPLRKPDPATDYFYTQRTPFEKSGFPRNDLPYADYAERRQHWKH